MSQADNVFEYLKENYQENEPVFLSELSVPEISDVSVRQQLRN